MIEQFHALLDSLRVGTLITLAGIGCIVWGYATGDLSINEAFKYLAYAGGTGTAVGIMRTYSGKGIK